MPAPSRPPAARPTRRSPAVAAAGLAAALLLGAGCAATSPAVRYDPAGDRVYDPSLVGTWRSDPAGGDGPTVWELERAGEFGYTLRVAAPAGSPGGPRLASGAIPVDLVEVGDRAYLFPSGGDDVRAAASGVLIRLDRTGPGAVRASMLDAARLADVLAADEAAVASSTTTAGDPPPAPPSLSLRTQLLARGDDAALFVPVAELRKVD